jgi:hypothetical protein
LVFRPSSSVIGINTPGRGCSRFSRACGGPVTA